MLANLPAASAVFAVLCLSSIASAQTPPAPTPPPAAAPAYVPTPLTPEPGLPRTPDGRPDFQSVVWATNFFPVFEASPMAATLVVSETDARKMVDTMVAGMTKMPDFAIDPEAGDIIGGTDGLPIVRGERRSRLIVLPADGKLPLSEEAKKLVANDGKSGDRMDSYETRPTGERCLVLGGNPPFFALISYNRMRMVQTKDHVVIHSENGDEARIVPFATQHKPPGPTSWFGDSIARWDGDTLVVETIRQHPRTKVRGLTGKFVVGEDAVVTERFTRVSANELLYQFTIEDPGTYTAPWLGEFSFYSVGTGMFPSPCHEHNLSLPNILQGARVIEARTVKPKP